MTHRPIISVKGSYTIGQLLPVTSRNLDLRHSPIQKVGHYVVTPSKIQLCFNCRQFYCGRRQTFVWSGLSERLAHIFSFLPVRSVGAVRSRVRQLRDTAAYFHLSGTFELLQHSITNGQSNLT